MNPRLLPVRMMLPVSLMLALAVSLGVAAAQTRQAPGPERTSDLKHTQQYEYTRVELMPEIGSFTTIREVAVTTPGVTEWTMLERHGIGRHVVGVTDMMTGQPLKFTLTPAAQRLRVTLARPIAGEGGQARLRVTSTQEADAYRRVNDDEAMFAFVAGFTSVRNAIVLPAGYRVIACNMPSQVLSLPDGRTQISFLWQSRGDVLASVQIRMKADAQTGDAARPRPLTNARSWEPPPAQGPPNARASPNAPLRTATSSTSCSSRTRTRSASITTTPKRAKAWTNT